MEKETKNSGNADGSIHCLELDIGIEVDTTRQYFANAQEIEVDSVFLARALTLSFRFCFWWVFDLRGSFRTLHLRNVCSFGD